MKFGSRIIGGRIARKFAWAAAFSLLGLFALRVYFVQELVAALILFALVFAAIALVALGLYLLDSAGQWSFRWMGRHSRWPLHLLKRGWTLAGEFSKKQFHRPRSAPAR